jgi:hypothetical protein
MTPGLEVLWEPDWDLGGKTHEDWYGEAYADLPNGQPDTCEVAYVVDDHGNVLASLGCIDNADEAYRREVERDLLSEAYPLAARRYLGSRGEQVAS